MAEHNMFRDGRMHVVEEECSTCVFRPGNQMHLRAGRLRGMVDEAVEQGGAIVCHCTLNTDENAVCRGFWDRHKDDVPILRLAQHMDIVQYDPPKKLGAAT
jgi:hypothetical protein